MIAAAGATHAIVGHSERRQYFGETDETVSNARMAAFEYRAHADCVRGRAAGRSRKRQTEAVLVSQFQKGIAGLTTQHSPRSVIAYEPVWAIGHRQDRDPRDRRPTPTPSRAEVREEVRQGSRRFSIRHLYGGSRQSPRQRRVLMRSPKSTALASRWRSPLDPV